jgi:hypothetical protein
MACLALLTAIVGALLAEAPTPKQSVRIDHYGDLLPPRAIARLGTVRFRQRLMADQAIFSPNGKMLASRDLEGSVRLWDAFTGKELADFGDGYVALRFSPDSKTLALGGEGRISIRDVADARELVRADGHPRGVLAMAFAVLRRARCRVLPCLMTPGFWLGLAVAKSTYAS